MDSQDWAGAERRRSHSLVAALQSKLMEEIEVLRIQYGVRRSAAVALVAERHGVPAAALDVEHFEWYLREAGADVSVLKVTLQRLASAP